MKKSEFAFDTDHMSPENANDNVQLNWLQRHVAGDKLSELQSQLEDKQRQILDTEQSNQKLLNEIEALKKKHQDTASKLKEHTVLIDKLSLDRDQLITSNHHLNTEIISKKNELQEYQKIKENWLKTKYTLESNVSVLNEKLKNIETYGKDTEMINKKNQKEIKRLNDANQELQEKLAQIQEEYQRIVNEKKEADDQATMRQEEMNAIQSRLEQHDDELQQQAEQYDLTLDRYRQALRHVQLTGSIALRQVMGGFSAALVRSVFAAHAPELLADYADIAEATEAIRACGQWCADLQLCADFDLHQEDGSLSCAWRAPHLAGDAATANEWVIGMLWALLNTKTDQQWSCHRACQDEVQAMQVAFRPMHH